MLRCADPLQRACRIGALVNRRPVPHLVQRKRAIRINGHRKPVQIRGRVSPDHKIDHPAGVVEDHHPTFGRRSPKDVVFGGVGSVGNLPGLQGVGKTPQRRMNVVDLVVLSVIGRHHPTGRVDRLLRNVLNLEKVGRSRSRLGNQDLGQFDRASPTRIVETETLPTGRQGLGGRHQIPKIFPGGNRKQSRISVDPVRNVVKLLGIFRSKLVGHGIPVRFHQGQVFAVAVQFEIRMQFAPRVVPILARGKHQQVIVRSEHFRGERPLGRIALVVGQPPAIRVDRIVARVVNLDPVGRIAVLVQPRADVGGHELADLQRVAGQQTARFQLLEGQSSRSAPLRAAG